MKVLLSIKPEFAEKIFSGEKKYEFRKRIFKMDNIDTIVVYASTPVRQVIGEFKIEKILQSSPKKIWEKTSKYSGISFEYFSEYFNQKKKAFAIQVKKTKKYKVPLDIQSVFNIKPPQSFAYIK